MYLLFHGIGSSKLSAGMGTAACAQCKSFVQVLLACKAIYVVLAVALLPV